MPTGIYKRTEEHTRGHFKKGQTPWNKGEKGIIGGSNGLWKGINVSYEGLHQWVSRYLGKPMKCEHCKTTEAKRFEWANKSKEYKRELSDWVRLCTSCHRKYDNLQEKMWITRRKLIQQNA